MVPERLAKLRALMKERGMSAYYIPSSDYHSSEYLGEHFKERRFMSGFTGSAGTLVVLADEAGLWTDGRYFLQADRQLEGTTIDLYKMGEEGVPTIIQFLKDKLPQNAVIGADGRTMTADFGNQLVKALSEKNAKLDCAEDLVGEIWEDRPALSEEPAYVLDVKYAGVSATEKLRKLREQMSEKGADIHVLTTLDDIAWLFNIRGGDVMYNPVILSYAIIEKTRAYLFVEEKKLSSDMKAYFEGLGVKIMPYNDVYDFARKTYGEGTSVLLSAAKVNYTLYDILREKTIIINAENPTTLSKAIKNSTETENVREAHIKDGVAMARFMRYLKENIGHERMTEISVSDRLEELRREQTNNLGLSFDTICGYGDHGAIIHYSATKETDRELAPHGLLLVDSGGQYFEGTTDITRTFALGELSEKEKQHFAMVLRSMLNLGAAKFLHGCRGVNLDVLARMPFWENNMNYNHGTGHGIGYLLNVHEAPNGFRWQIVPERQDSAILEEGMITTDEPGVYIENEFGIRLENEILTCRGEKNEYGQFMYFEHITYCPIDLDAVDVKYLTEIDRQRLNEYHKLVFEKLSPRLKSDEVEWLRRYTREI